MQVLPPGVEHGQEADLSAEQSGIGRGFEQGFRRGAEQQVVDRFGILQRQFPDLRRQSEHNVEIGKWQKLRLTLFQPAGARGGTAFWAVPVATGVI